MTVSTDYYDEEKSFQKWASRTAQLEKHHLNWLFSSPSRYTGLLWLLLEEESACLKK